MDDPALVLLQHLGEELGTPELSFDQDGYCHLVVNETVSLVIRSEPADAAIVLASIVANELPDPIRYTLLVELLEFALAPMTQSGPSIGLDPDVGALIGFVRLPVRLLNEQGFVQAVNRFLNWRDMMAERVGNPASVSDEMPDEAVNVDAIRV
jgi:hypothetical protein